MPSRIGRLNLATTAQQLTEESSAVEPDVPPAPTWIVPSAPTGSLSVRRRAAAADPLGGSPIPQQTATLLRQARGSGAPLSAPVARTAGEALGADLGSVRVHTDARADGLARSMQAVAFSYGPDMYFSAGSYRPQSDAGSHLLAHELSHIAEGPGGGSGPVIGRADDPAEARADAAATRLAPALRRSVADPQAGGAVGRTGIAQGGVISGDLRRMVLRRKIAHLSKTSADIDAANGSKVSKTNVLARKITGTKDTLYKIKKLVDTLRGSNDDEAALTDLAALIVLCDQWLGKNRGGDKPALTALIADLSAEASRDRSRALAQQRYLNDLQAGETFKVAPDSEFRGRGETQATPFTQQVGTDIHGKAENTARIAKRAPENLKTDKQRAIAELVNSCGLTQAEIAAIVTYTASDYLYINPATANDAGWMAGQQDSVAKASTQRGKGTDHLDQRNMRAEGVTHAGVLMQALAKMPVKAGPAYRGARMNRKEFNETYGRQTRVVYSGFTSTSTSLATCNQYARGASERGPRKDQTISVKAYLTVTDGRDVKLLSDAGGENEWLLLPGATFAITDIVDDPDHEPGVDEVPATEWKIVYLKQVANKLRPSKPAGPPTAAELQMARLAKGKFTIY